MGGLPEGDLLGFSTWCMRGSGLSEREAGRLFLIRPYGKGLDGFPIRVGDRPERNHRMRLDRPCYDIPEPWLSQGSR
jgi:hypothetical protein